MGSKSPSFSNRILQSKVLPALDLQPLSGTCLPESRADACFSESFFPQNPKSLNPHPEICFHVPSSCFPFLLEEQA